MVPLRSDEVQVIEDCFICGTCGLEMTLDNYGLYCIHCETLHG